MATTSASTLVQIRAKHSGFPKFKIVQIILGGGGCQENYVLFHNLRPFLMLPWAGVWAELGKNGDFSLILTMTFPEIEDTHRGLDLT